jgi:hypothetical protein
MDKQASCERCGKKLAKRKLKEVVYEEGRDRVRMMVCPSCLDQVMNESQLVRGVVGTEKRAAAHIDRGPGSAERQSLGRRS